MEAENTKSVAPDELKSRIVRGLKDTEQFRACADKTVEAIAEVAAKVLVEVLTETE